MKNIAIIGLTFCPLLSGCAGFVAEHDLRQTASIHRSAAGDPGSQMRALRRRVNTLQKQVAAQRQHSYAADQSGLDSREMRQRLAKVERELSESRRRMATEREAPQPGGDEPRAGLQEQLARMDTRLEHLARAQQGAADKYNKLNAELEKDRTIVIDYLQQIEKRIEDLEQARQATPAKP